MSSLKHKLKRKDANIFLSTLKTLGAVVLISALSVAGAPAAEWSYEAGKIPVTIDLSGVKIADGPIYMSVQKRGQYMGMKGHGVILKTATPGNMPTTRTPTFDDVKIKVESFGMTVDGPIIYPS